METELVKYGQIGVILFLVSILFWVIKRGFDLYDSLNKNIEANTEVTKASHEYLKLRNGSMEAQNKSTAKILENICVRLDNVSDKNDKKE